MSENNNDSITVLGKEYIRLYDRKGKLKKELDVYGINAEESIKELEKFGLVDVVKVKGIKYYRTLPPKI